jgi:hypothetical protein
VRVAPRELGGDAPIGASDLGTVLLVETWRDAVSLGGLAPSVDEEADDVAPACWSAREGRDVVPRVCALAAPDAPGVADPEADPAGGDPETDI